jgi:hypothetical protein
MVLFP